MRILQNKNEKRRNVYEPLPFGMWLCLYRL